MHSPTSRPSLRPVESIVVADPRHGRVHVLRDTQGLTESQAVIPAALLPIVARFTGERSCAMIARDASVELGEEVPVDVVVQLADQLDAALFLDSPTSRKARDRIEREFREASVRPASHAGQAYEGEADALRAYVDESCLGRARSAPGAGGNSKHAAHTGNGHSRGHVVGLIAPHIDPWRGAIGYGHAYRALAEGLPPEADTFIVFGTSHAPMREHFALCRKTFATPLGPLEADIDAIDALTKNLDFDPFADELNHKREHSLEFQAVFLRHVLGTRRARIVPILAGLGRHQARGTNPADDAVALGFLDALRELIASRPGRVVLVAGADLAHVGPRFGDAAAYDGAQRESLAKTDQASLERAVSGDALGFWSHVAKDLDTRRVCGLGPIYSLLSTLPEEGRGGARLLHYEQTVDPDEGSIVSHAAVAFYRE